MMTKTTASHNPALLASLISYCNRMRDYNLMQLEEHSAELITPTCGIYYTKTHQQMIETKSINNDLNQECINQGESIIENSGNKYTI